MLSDRLLALVRWAQEASPEIADCVTEIIIYEFGIKMFNYYVVLFSGV